MPDGPFRPSGMTQPTSPSRPGDPSRPAGPWRPAGLPWEGNGEPDEPELRPPGGPTWSASAETATPAPAGVHNGANAELEAWPDDGGGGGGGGVYEQLPKEWSKRRRWSLTVAIVATLVLALLLAGGIYIKNRFDPPGSPGAEVDVTIPRGSSLTAIGDLLQSKGVIPNATAFRAYVKYKGVGPFKAGTYKLHKNSAVWEVIPDLKAGPALAPQTGFTLLPGLTLAEMPAAIVHDLPSLNVDKINAVLASGAHRSRYQTDPNMSYEGFLAPDTYQTPVDVTEDFVVKLMVDQFDRVANDVGLNRSRELAQGYDPYSVLIVASMVEKEAKVPGDRAKIAGVIYNRLKINMKLGIDSTICYFKQQQPCKLTQTDLDTAEPYNTRLNAGLPPTPIAFVSKASLEAALNPVLSDNGKTLLYFVLDPSLGPGAHMFTDNQKDFNAAVTRCHQAEPDQC
jgi:UPF0755 protein